VLGVTAFELRDPLLLLILMKSDDVPVRHCAISIQFSEGTAHQLSCHNSAYSVTHPLGLTRSTPRNLASPGRSAS
jgi:hypothetical protein